MPLKRTPPASPGKTRSASKTRKPKRRREGSFDDNEANASFRKDIFRMFEEFKLEQKNNFKLLQDTITQQNKEIQTSLEFLSVRYDEIHGKLESFEAERKTHLAYIQSLEDKVENLENSSNSASLEIRNIPVKASENKTDLTNVIVNTGLVLQTSIQPSDIRNIYRENTKSNIKPIIVEFTTVAMKENILKLTKTYNKNHSSKKLSTKDLHFEDPQKPVYISESLTHKTRRLFSLSRQFATLNGFAYCWTSIGKIYLRKKEGDPYHRINSEHDFIKLKHALF
ncbi:unnamed protein product, partial [Brenthis ino]